MSERKIVVPEGMLKAAFKSYSNEEISDSEVESILEAALRWLSENPIVPTCEAEWKLHSAWGKSSKPQSTAGGEIASQIRFSLVEWQRRMFLAPEPEVPDLDEIIIIALQENDITVTNGRVNASAALQAVAREAYKRGKNSKEKP